MVMNCLIPEDQVLTVRTHRRRITAKLGIKGGELILLASAFMRHAP